MPLQIKNMSILLHPIIPIATGKVLKILNLDCNIDLINTINKTDCFDHEKELNHSGILFKKIDHDN